MAAPNLDDYQDVAERLRRAKEQYPDCRLTSADPNRPYDIVVIDNQAYVVMTTAFYRTPDDPRPGIGVAWEPTPGKTPYTKNSEIMNCQTSSWGRAMVAAGVAEVKRSIASRDEVKV